MVIRQSQLYADGLLTGQFEIDVLLDGSKIISVDSNQYSADSANVGLAVVKVAGPRFTTKPLNQLAVFFSFDDRFQ